MIAPSSEADVLLGSGTIAYKGGRGHEPANALLRYALVHALPQPSPPFVDIGANLTDSVFAGTYRGRAVHESTHAPVAHPV
jgi:hypothetical protein